jgi:hypothetical protein
MTKHSWVKITTRSHDDIEKTILAESHGKNNKEISENAIYSLADSGFEWKTAKTTTLDDKSAKILKKETPFLKVIKVKKDKTFELVSFESTAQYH